MSERPAEESLAHAEQRQRAAWAAGRPELVEALLAGFPGLALRPEQVLDLIYHEILFREEKGEKPALNEYRNRFPELGDPLAELFAVHGVFQETQARGPAPETEEWPLTQVGGSAGAGVSSFAPFEPPGYEVLGEIGQGGMGVVYRARQIGLNRLVALKTVRGTGADAEEKVRFRREAEAVARLSHPGIVQIYETGEHQDRPFFAMELVEGGPLAGRLQGTPVPARDAATLMRGLALALQHAHQHGVIHRDLKPANVLLVSAVDGPGLTAAVAKIADFGLAKQTGEQALTATEAILGTPAYMAPEQASGRSKGVGAAADVYGLGAILYECLTGRPPFKGETALDTAMMVIHDDPVPPRQLNPRVPVDLETICLKCLEKTPARRYETAEALAQEITRFLEGRPILARPANVWDKVKKWARRRPGVAMLSATTVLATVVGLALVTWKWREAVQARASESQAWAQTLEGQADKVRAEERAAQGEWSRYLRGMLASERAWQANLIDDAEKFLDDTPAEHRGWEWHFSKRRCRPALLSLRASRAGIKAVAVSADGRLLATGGGGMDLGGKPQPVTVWDAAAGLQLLTLPGQTDPISDLAFSPDGKYLASATYWQDQARIVRGDAEAREHHRGQVVVWEVATGRVVKTIAGAYGLVSFSARGSRFACVGQKALARIWDTTGAEWKELPPLPAYQGVAGSMALTPGGESVAVSTSHLIASRPGDVRFQTDLAIWDVGTQKRKAALPHPGEIERIAFSPDGRRLAAAGMDRSVRIWEVSSGRQLLVLWGHTDTVFGLAFDHDGGRLLSGGRDQSVRLWETVSGRELGKFRGHDESVKAVAFVPVKGGPARAVSGDESGAVRVWDPERLDGSSRLRGHRAFVCNLAYSPDGRWLASTSQMEGKVIVWDLATRKPARELSCFAEKLAFSPDGSRLVTAGGTSLTEPGEVKVWDARNWRLERTVPGVELYATGIAVSPDGRLLAFSDGVAAPARPGTVKVVDLASGRILHSFRPDVGVVTHLDFSPDGEEIAITSLDHQVALCRPSGEGLRRLGRHPATAMLARFSPDGRLLASGDAQGLVQIWDVARGELKHRLVGHGSAVSGLSFHPDGTRLASASSGLGIRQGKLTVTANRADVRVWELSGGREVLVLPGQMAAAFSPDRDHLAAVAPGDFLSPGVVRIWDGGKARETSRSGDAGR